MFTAFRATAIGLGAIAFAVITYAYTLFMTAGGDQYPALILRTLFLAFVLAAGTSVMYRTIRERTHKEQPKSDGQLPSVSKPGTKEGE
jgi:Na+/melibiose symporter-like transporter